VTPLELLAYLTVGALGGFAALVLFAAVGSSILRREIDEFRARKELLQAQRLEEGFPDFDSHLEPLSIGVELDKQAGRDRQVRGAGSVLGEPTDINNARGRAVADYETGPPACRPIRVHRRERATLPARRGDR
jgi:hypothetical protein